MFWKANGMSGAQQKQAMTADSLHVNGTAALELHDEDVNTAFGVWYHSSYFHFTVLLQVVSTKKKIFFPT